MSGSMGTGRQGTTGGMGQASTGAPNVTFDLVSALFHALDGGSAVQQYIQDAQQAGDNELVQFFQQISQQNRQRAQQAEQLLAQRLGGGQPSH
jgi:hypothetical protein